MPSEVLADLGVLGLWGIFTPQPTEAVHAKKKPRPQTRTAKSNPLNDMCNELGPSNSKIKDA